MPPFDTIVIGAGIGGACAALALVRRGAAVALIEAGSIPRHKVCGEFLSPESRDIFARLGVEEAVLAAQPQCVTTARIVTTRGRSLEIPLPDGAIALSRFRLDHILWDAANAAGVCCLSRTRAQSIEHTTEGFVVTTSNGQLQARCVIAAPGRNAAWLERSRRVGEWENGGVGASRSRR
ncbi:MAG: FAD-dependent monooxygenase, partial [Armatimonadota bacterium]|nr:FAD-dependent monooxygenase [Armatimonadota bacterium]